MTALLPPPQHQIPTSVERKLRRRWRLSLAAATVIASIVAATTTLLVNRPRQNEVREDIERLEAVVAQQKQAIDSLARAADENTREVRAVRQTLAAIPTTTSFNAQPDTTRQADSTAPLETRPAAGAITSAEMKEQDRYQLALDSCQKSGGSVTCRLLITNKDDQEREITLYKGGDTRAFANNGGEYGAETCRLGAGPNAREQLKLPGGITVPATVYFANLPQNVHLFTVLQITFWSSSSGRNRVEWRNISLLQS